MDFIKARAFWYPLSVALTVVGVAAFAFVPKNLGVDMTGGVMVEVKASGSVDRALADRAVTSAKSFEFEGKRPVSEATAYPVTGTDLVRVEAGFSNEFTGTGLEAAKSAFRARVPAILAELGVLSSENRYTDIGKSFGDYVMKTAYVTLALAIAAIALYVAWAFRHSVEGISSFSLGLITLVTLFHDVVVAGGLYVIVAFFFPEFKFDTFTITALLTILGYSINDTIVILDRVRSTVRDRKVGNMPLEKIVNASVNAVLMRSLYTPLTLILVLVPLFFFGPEAIRGFMLVLLVGTAVGTYSSVCVSAPMVYDMNKSTYGK